MFEKLKKWWKGQLRPLPITREGVELTMERTKIRGLRLTCPGCGTKGKELHDPAKKIIDSPAKNASFRVKCYECGRRSFVPVAFLWPKDIWPEGIDRLPENVLAQQQ